MSESIFVCVCCRELITHLNSRRPGQEWQGYVLALTLFVCGLLRAVFYACSNYRAYYTGLQIKSVVIGAVYCKVPGQYALP